MRNFLLGLVVAFLISAGITQVMQPDCPTEDSCSLVREDGKTKIVEVTP